MVQVGEHHRTLMIFCIALTFWLSVLIRAFAWVMILRTEGVLNTTLLSLGMIEEPLRLVRNEIGVLIGMAHYMLPIAMLPMYSSMQRYLANLRQCGARTRRERVADVFLGLSALDQARHYRRGGVGVHFLSRLLHHSAPSSAVAASS